MGKRGSRRADQIGLELDRILEASVRQKKIALMEEIRKHFHFQELIEATRGARNEDNERLAHALLEARWQNISVTSVVEEYARKFIYPYRKH